MRKEKLIIKKLILIALGWVFIALGVIGIFVPLMPSTIFFILAAWCFSRSSEKFYNRLINHPRVGKIVRDYYEKRGLPLKTKIVSITTMTAVIGISALFFTDHLIVRLLLLTIAVSVSIYIISLKTLREEITSESE
ncbi:MAG: DUF454 domain-containing protein [Ignavibacteriae bacterium HGW-Ignavibacteriae-3]|nr:MAG: DUF454 domain-containing protein [Ignavibacteriae bacterium HGW-Ignavibacteriae-3]